MSSDRESRKDNRELRVEVQEMKDTMTLINEHFEKFKSELERVLNDNKELKKENERLQKQCLENETCTKELENRLTQCEQYSRRYNLEIKGVVEREHENIATLMEKVGEVLEEPILASEIEVCHRVPTRNERLSKILVHFKSRQKRDLVFEKARKKRITNNSLGVTTEPGESAPVFVNEHLCPTLKRLLASTIARKRQFSWRFVWTRNGRILTRKTHGSRTLHVSSDNDLFKMT